MFQSYSYKYLDFDQKSKNWTYEILIVDDDFQEIVTSSYNGDNTASSCALIELIKIYSKRNLNVSKNIFSFFIYIKTFGSDYDFNNQISWYKKYVPEFDKYLPEIEKFLLIS